VSRILPPTFKELNADDPREIGGFTLLGRLGAGGMGTAYLAEGHGQWVVVKVLRADLADNSAFRTRLGRELDSLRRLNSPEGIAVLAEDLECPAPWFAMEFVEGQTLTDRIRTVGPLTGKALLGFTQDLAARIEAIHRSGITHRDIKPSNIVLSPSGPRIIDFGVALVDERTAMTTSGVMIGTLGWASPEQVAGDPVGPAADVHAWGLCALYAGTGQVPFEADSAAGLLYKVLHTQPSIPAGLPDGLSDQISAALRKDPVLRPRIEDIRQGRLETPTRRSTQPPLDATRLDQAERTIQIHPTEATITETPSKSPNRRSRKTLIGITAGSAAAVALAATIIGVIGISGDTASSPDPSTPPTSPISTAPNTPPTDRATPSTAASSTPAEPTEPIGPPNVLIQSRSGQTPLYEVSWDAVSVEGPDRQREREINDLLNDFTNVAAEEYLAIDGAVDVASGEVRGGYDANIEQISCEEPYICFVQRGSYFPPGGISSFFFTETFVVDYKRPRPVTIEDFVEPNQLGTLVTLTERAISATDEYNQVGGPIALEPTYDQFRNAIPFDNGLLIYFGEQSVGPMPSEVYVPWDLSGNQPTVLPQVNSGVDDSRAYICPKVPSDLPPLVAADSDSQAVRALQVVLLDVFGFDPGPIDGQYGPRTIAAVKRMQSALGVVPDGQVGPITWGALQSQLCYRS
jgi:serine/threonine protein kinase